MENEQMNQTQPTYEQVVQAYSNLIKDFESLRIELESIKTDKLLEKIKLMLDIVKNSSAYPNDIVSLAKWNLKKMMGKPEKSK